MHFEASVTLEMGKFVLAFLLAGVSSLAMSADYALRFSPNDKAAIPDSESLNLVRGLTMECWIKPDADSPDQMFRFLISRNGGGAGYGLLLKLGFEVQSANQGQLPVIVEKDKWTHVAYATNNRVSKLYINGILRQTIEPTDKLLVSRTPLWIGSSPFVGLPGDQPTSFSGLIDEVRIWSTPRSRTQIQRDMRRAISGRTRQLVVYLRFNEGSGLSSVNLTSKTKPLAIGISPSTPEWEQAPPLSRR